MTPAPDMISPPPVQRRRRATTTAPPSVDSPPSSSRRPSQVMGPPTLPYNQNIYSGGPALATVDYGSAGAGPLRHPKPLTPSDLHSVLEKEQEAIVNRLTRELSSLRQQTASVASTTSSTSATPNESGDTQHSSPHPSSAAYSTPSGRHRSSSSLSSYIPAVQGSRTRSVSGVAPPRDASAPGSRPPADLPRSTRSRETSVTSPQQSEGGSLSSSLPHQNSLSQHSMTRFEETTLHRGELESIRRENETLRQRVRDLEHTVKRYREGSTETTDADTDETNASTATG